LRNPAINFVIACPILQSAAAFSHRAFPATTRDRSQRSLMARANAGPGNCSPETIAARGAVRSRDCPSERIFAAGAVSLEKR
jgi:hypothetical protein